MRYRNSSGSWLSITARAGWWNLIVFLSIAPLYHHAIGKAAYLRQAADGWSDGWWVVPFNIAALLAGLAGIWRCLGDEKAGRS